MEPVSQRLLAWYHRNKRDLPWRRRRDPWAIWVSEVMLQQTRVEAVRDTYERFLAAYPDPASFSVVDDEELHTAWQGLGYYRRARLLREGARCVVRDHGGRVPGDATLLGALPGIGAYTKGAIGSIAFGLPLPAVDGNVERVVSRHRLLRDNIKSTAMQREVRETVGQWLEPSAAGDFNQALMELGATVCTPGRPRCNDCPIAADCMGLEAGIEAELPLRPRPRSPVQVTAHALVAHRGSDILSFRIPAGEPNAGQFELPGPGALCSADVEDVTELTRGRCGVTLRPVETLATVRHAITHHRITVTAHRATGTGRGLPALCPTDPRAPWTTISRKVFAALERRGLLET